MKITRRFTSIIAILAISALAGASYAADVIKLPASVGKVTFTHKKHQVMLKDCKKCHEKGPGKIKELDKEWAHKTCKGCHSEGFNGKKGPTACKGCHKK